mmetsp:Transcript_8379/g.26209  ORF Transcript_8379/g.26209 Transcript_8379/m.26209 type:complete len:200 (+) Transcript_8379:1420-2019(+)
MVHPNPSLHGQTQLVCLLPRHARGKRSEQVGALRLDCGGGAQRGGGTGSHGARSLRRVVGTGGARWAEDKDLLPARELLHDQTGAQVGGAGVGRRRQQASPRSGSRSCRCPSSRSCAPGRTQLRLSGVTGRNRPGAPLVDHELADGHRTKVGALQARLEPTRDVVQVGQRSTHSYHLGAARRGDGRSQRLPPSTLCSPQ